MVAAAPARRRRGSEIPNHSTKTKRRSEMTDRTEKILMLALAVVYVVAIAVALHMLWMAKAYGSPYLSAPAPEDGGAVEWWEIEGLPGSTGQYPHPLHHDLAGLLPGDYTVRVRCCNVWHGCGEWSPPFAFTPAREAPGVPGEPALTLE
jgi:hypothetical protein